MNKISLWLALVHGVCVLTPTFAEPPRGVENIKEVAWGEERKRQTFPRLQIADLPELDTRVLYASRGAFFREAIGLVILLPGTAGTVDGTFGIEQSLAPLANYLVKKGYAVLGFQPPIYWNQGSKIETYSSLENNLEWVKKVYGYSRSQIAPVVPIQFYGRSTGAALGLECLHRYVRGDAGFEFVGEFSQMLLVSIDGHTEAEIKRWYAAELIHPEGDPAVTEAGPKIFRDMRWQTEKIVVAKRVPKVTLAVGTRDEFSQAKESLQVVADFRDNHPGLRMGLALYDGAHEPAREIRVDGRKIAETMARLGLILGDAYSPVGFSAEGFNPFYYPNEEELWRSMDAENAEICRRIVGAAA